MTVDDGGMVVLYSMKDLKRPPLVFEYVGVSHADNTISHGQCNDYSNSVSTWGIAMHQGTKRVAVSSNSHEITICTIQSLDLSLRQLTRLSGHSHNVPAVDFSHCGRFIVSGSIDGICRVWNAETGDVIASHSFVNLKWCVLL